MIAILDSDLGLRASQLARKAARLIPNASVYVVREDCVLAYHPEHDALEPATMGHGNLDLVFVHSPADEGRLDGATDDARRLRSCQAVIRYGGRIEPKGREWWICRSLRNGRDVEEIPDSEMNDLLTWALSGCDPGNQPMLLCSSVQVEVLPALNWLCQGYLAHWARRNTGGIVPHVVKAALEEIGWLGFVKDLPFKPDVQEADTQSDERGDPENAVWWATALGLSGDVAERERLLSAVPEGHEAVRALLMRISDRQRLDDPTEVARACLALIRRRSQ